MFNGSKAFMTRSPVVAQLKSHFRDRFSGALPKVDNFSLHNKRRIPGSYICALYGVDLARELADAVHSG